METEIEIEGNDFHYEMNGENLEKYLPEKKSYGYTFYLASLKNDSSEPKVLGIFKGKGLSTMAEIIPVENNERQLGRQIEEVTVKYSPIIENDTRPIDEVFGLENNVQQEIIYCGDRERGVNKTLVLKQISSGPRPKSSSPMPAGPTPAAPGPAKAPAPAGPEKTPAAPGPAKAPADKKEKCHFGNCAIMGGKSKKRKHRKYRKQKTSKRKRKSKSKR